MRETGVCSIKEESFSFDSKRLVTIVWTKESSQVRLIQQPEVNPFNTPPINCAAKVLDSVSPNDFLWDNSIAHGLNGTIKSRISLIKTDEHHPFYFFGRDLPSSGTFFTAVPFGQEVVLNVSPSFTVRISPNQSILSEGYAGLFFSYEQLSELKIQVEYASVIQLKGDFTR